MIVRLKGVKRVRSKGRIYYYHRGTMTRLPGQLGSDAFMAALTALEARSVATAAPGTLGGLLRAYRAAPEFSRLSAGSQRQYQVRFNRLKAFEGVPLAAITPKRVYELRDRLLEKHSRTAANNIVAMLRMLFEWAIRRDLFDGQNPAAKVDAVRRPKDAPVVNRRWTDRELAIVVAEAPAWLKVAIAIAAYTGMRESDVVAVTWSSYDGTGFEIRMIKTGDSVWIPAHRDLRAVLDGAPRVSPNIVIGMRGRPMTVNSLGSRFFDFIRDLRERGLVGPGLSFHGLRHTLATRLAEAGCDPGTIAAVLGHRQARQSEHYSRTADRRQLAKSAIEALERTPAEQKMENRDRESGKPTK